MLISCCHPLECSHFCYSSHFKLYNTSALHMLSTINSICYTWLATPNNNKKSWRKIRQLFEIVLILCSHLVHFKVLVHYRNWSVFCKCYYTDAHCRLTGDNQFTCKPACIPWLIEFLPYIHNRYINKKLKITCLSDIAIANNPLLDIW